VCVCVWGGRFGYPVVVTRDMLFEFHVKSGMCCLFAVCLFVCLFELFNRSLLLLVLVVVVVVAVVVVVMMALFVLVAEVGWRRS